MIWPARVVFKRRTQATAVPSGSRNQTLVPRAPACPTGRPGRCVLSLLYPSTVTDLRGRVGREGAGPNVERIDVPIFRTRSRRYHSRSGRETRSRKELRVQLGVALANLRRWSEAYCRNRCRDCRRVTPIRRARSGSSPTSTSDGTGRSQIHLVPRSQPNGGASPRCLR